MSGNVSRRVFVGSVAAGVPVVVGAGVAAWPFTELQGQAESSARQQYGPVVSEVRRQLKNALDKMRDGQSGGARQLATTLRIYASTVNDGQLQAALRKVNRQQLLLTEMDHKELSRQAAELGVNPSILPPHTVDRVGREAALDRLLKDGLSQSLREAADYVDGIGTKMDRLERTGHARPLQVALRQPIPDTVDCGNCNQEKSQVESAAHFMEVACAAAFLFPLLVPACEAASATYIVIVTAAAICNLVVQLCEAYYH